MQTFAYKDMPHDDELIIILTKQLPSKTVYRIMRLLQFCLPQSLYKQVNCAAAQNEIVALQDAVHIGSSLG